MKKPVFFNYLSLLATTLNLPAQRSMGSAASRSRSKRRSGKVRRLESCMQGYGHTQWFLTEKKSSHTSLWALTKKEKGSIKCKLSGVKRSTIYGVARRGHTQCTVVSDVEENAPDEWVLVNKIKCSGVA